MEPKKLRIAAVDVGTNSIHCIVCDTKDDGTLEIVEKFKEQVRLGSQIKDGVLTDTALEKTEKVLQKIKETAKNYGIPVRAVGTFALREAKNGLEFVRQLRQKTGIEIQIVPGLEEARLIYLGLEHSFSLSDQNILVMDIGGGSTEFVIARQGEIHFSHSAKMGAVRLSDRFFSNSNYTVKEMEALQDFVSAKMEGLVAEISRTGFDTAYGSSGTIKTIKSIALGLAGKSIPKSMHGEKLTVEEIRLVKDSLWNAPQLAQRLKLPHLDAKRADIIFAGLTLVDNVTRQSQIEEWVLSDAALREGVAWDAFQRRFFWIAGDPLDIRWASVKSLAKKMGIDEAFARHISVLCSSLFDQLSVNLKLTREWREYLRVAAYLHEIGKFVSISGYHKHAAYLLRNSEIQGYSFQELQYMSALLRYQRKRPLKKGDEWIAGLSAEEIDNVEKCSAILRMAIACDVSRQGSITKVTAKFKDGGKSCKCEFSKRLKGDISAELYALKEEQKLFEKSFGFSLQFE